MEVVVIVGDPDLPQPQQQSQRREEFDVFKELSLTLENSKELEKRYVGQHQTGGITEDRRLQSGSAESLGDPQQPSSVCSQLSGLTEYLERKASERKALLIKDQIYLPVSQRHTPEKADSLAVCEACTDFNIEEVLKENFALKNKVVVLRDELRLQSRTEVSEGRVSPDKLTSATFGEATPSVKESCTTCTRLTDQLQSLQSKYKNLDEDYLKACDQKCQTQDTLDSALKTVRRLDSQLEESSFEKFKFQQLLRSLSSDLNDTSENLSYQSCVLSDQSIAAKMQIEVKEETICKKDAALDYKERLMKERDDCIAELQKEIDGLKEEVKFHKSESKKWRRSSDSFQAMSEGQKEELALLKEI